MAIIDGSKLIELPEALSLDDSDLLYVVDDGDSCKATVETLKTAVTPSDFTGATSGTAGANGLVPAPSAGDNGKVLQGDGTWTNRLTTAESNISDIKDKAEETIYVDSNGKFYVYVEEE